MQKSCIRGHMSVFEILLVCCLVATDGSFPPARAASCRVQLRERERIRRNISLYILLDVTVLSNSTKVLHTPSLSNQPTRLT